MVFSVFTLHGSKEKISGSDFEIRATNFKKQATNFLPPETPPGWCRRPMALWAHIRLPACPENADKQGAYCCCCARLAPRRVAGAYLAVVRKDRSFMLAAARKVPGTSHPKFMPDISRSDKFVSLKNPFSFILSRHMRMCGSRSACRRCHLPS